MPDNQLKIAMLSVHSCPVGTLGTKDTGGMSVYIRELAHQLGKLGNRVDIFTRAHNPEHRQIIELSRNVRLIHLAAGEVDEIPKLATYPLLPHFIENLDDFRRDNSLRYDLLFSHYWLSACVGKELQVSWDIPHMVMFHTLGAVKNAIGIGEKEPELRIEGERDAVQSCHRIIASTEREKEALIEYYGAMPERIGIVPCGVNPDLFHPSDKEKAKRELGFTDQKVILFVGRIEPLKGIDRLLQAITYLPEKTGLKLVIIGGGEQSRSEMERLQKLSDQLGIRDMVVFPGVVEHQQLPRYYNAADVSVVASYYESFGLVALESLACGIPVIATDVGDLRDIIRQGETGYIVDSNVPRSLAEKITLILNQPKQNSTQIRESVLRFSWSKIAEAIISEYRILNSFSLTSLTRGG
ncbi:MAG: glycosyltransferase [Chloroflexota bacterium]